MFLGQDPRKRRYKGCSRHEHSQESVVRAMSLRFLPRQWQVITSHRSRECVQGDGGKVRGSTAFTEDYRG